MKEFLLLIFIIASQINFGQTTDEKIIHGKIIVEKGNSEGVTIINLVNEKSTISDSHGEFYILAKADDLLVFSSLNLEYYRKIIETEDLKPEILFIKMTAKITELKEVIVNKHPEINAVSLGISPKGIKKYTPAERRLFTANSTPVDALLNLMSGRTTMLKKELEVEKKEHLLVLFDALFEENYFTKTLKIPNDYVNGFKYYCVEEKNFAEVLLTKNKIKIELLIIPLASKYNEIITNEN